MGVRVTITQLLAGFKKRPFKRWVRECQPFTILARISRSEGSIFKVPWAKLVFHPWRQDEKTSFQRLKQKQCQVIELLLEVYFIYTVK